MSKNYILLNGTSSSGKSTICEYLSKKNFVCIQFDKYQSYKLAQYYNMLKTIKNKYGEFTRIDGITDKTDDTYKKMVNDAIKIHTKTHKNIIFDDVTTTQKEIIHDMKLHKLYNQLYIIILFTNLDNLARNMVSRTKKGEFVDMNIYLQFTNIYTKCDNNDDKRIEIVNREHFKNILLKHLKYLFNNIDELNETKNFIFNRMNIHDDKDHYIKVRDDYKYDYILVTTNKTKIDIFNELDEKIKSVNNSKNKTRKNK